MNADDHREEEASAARHLASTMRQRAEQLRALADGIDRSAKDVEDLPGMVVTGVAFATDDYATLISRALRDVLWGTANLNLDTWVTRAHETDRHRQAARMETTS